MLTVAIPTYGRGAILVDTIGRLLALTPPPDEVLVIDQTAKHPPDVLRNLDAMLGVGTVRLIKLPEPSIPHAMNVALREARNEVVLFMDDDVEPSADLIEQHLLVHHQGDYMAVAGQVLQPGETPVHHEDRVLRRGAVRDLQFRFNHDSACDVQNVMAGNLSVKRSSALAAGGFDENFSGAAYRFETDFALRLVAAGGRIRYEPLATLRHLKIDSGGIRAFGDHRTTGAAAHATGDYYFARRHISGFFGYVMSRLRRNLLTRWHARHPWWIPVKLIGELRALITALRLHDNGPRFAAGE